MLLGEIHYEIFYTLKTYEGINSQTCKILVCIQLLQLLHDSLDAHNVSIQAQVFACV